MRGCAVLLVALWLAAPADSDTPGDFLKVESRAWNGWLNQEANVSWAGVALEDVLAGEFGPADLEIDPPGAMATAVTFDASDLSRREALWRLSQRYAFRVKWVRTDEPRVYLGLPETEERRQSVGGVVLVTMTQVMRTDYGNYESLKRRGKVRDEERVGNTIYFAVDDWRDLPFADGTSAMVPFVERYKTSSASIRDAENAKAALLRLIRGNRKVFVGDPDPDRLENLAVEAYDPQEPSKFSWGGFIIDVKNRSYSAAIGGEGTGMWFYSGVFEVDAAGRWTAGQPKSQHAATPPPKG